jgi:hypothetical protein
VADCRWIFTKYILISDFCNWKTKIAINANIIQASDAELARNTIANVSTLTVHDSFGVNLNELHKLMDNTNKYFNNKNNNKTYSIFILI